jgi:probable F420-dependent oxidoreductase
MKFDAALAPMHLDGVPAVAKAAEEMGFDALWTQETQHNPFLPCALIAEHSQKMEFGTAIAVSFARSPADLAYTAWDLAAQSGGRFILGLGTQVRGHIEKRFGMSWPESPVVKLREQIQVLRAFWDCWQNGAPLRFEGEYYKIKLMSPFFNPGPLTPAPSTLSGTRPAGRGESIIPIYIAGVNTGLARLAGELCDGFHVHPFHSPDYLRQVILPAIEEGAARAPATNAGQAGGSRADVSVSVTAFVATTPEEENFARAQISFYASTPSYRPVFALHGWEGVAETLSKHAARGEWGEMFGLVTDEILQTFCLVSDADSLPAKLKERYKGIADRLTLYTPFTPGEKDGFWKKLVEAF